MIIDAYTIEKMTVEKIANDRELFTWIIAAMKKESELYPEFNWRKFPLAQYVERYRFMICRRNGKPVGMMLSRLYTSIFDLDLKILMQDVLFVQPGTRAAKLLLEDFIDFGKANANHIITQIAVKTNIKARSLERLGFHELETLYRMEI